MNKHTRYLESAIRDDLRHKMVFLGGPRQVGKTTLARSISSHYQQPAYLNWDNPEHRGAILKLRWKADADMLIFDELHKYLRWKSLIKGIWDTRGNDEHIMVTGSSRLDIYRRGGDSLLGRYHYYRLHPFSLSELTQGKSAVPLEKDSPPVLAFSHGDTAATDQLLRFGGFPEPFLAASERSLRRWHRERFERVMRQDIRETESIRSLSQIELLAAMIPDRVGTPLSFQSLSEDLGVSPKSVTSWMELLCRNYYVFRVPPWHRLLARALKKESKYYLWDWSEVTNDGARFENMVASHLLKWCHYHQDVSGLDVELYYVRDLEKREVDFVIVWNKKPWLLVECKLGGNYNFSQLNNFARKLGIKDQAYTVTLAPNDDFIDKSTSIRVIPAHRFLSAFV